MGSRIRGHWRENQLMKRKKGGQHLDRNWDGKEVSSYQEYSRQKTKAEWMKWGKGQSAGRHEGQRKLRDKARRRVKGKGHRESSSTKHDLPGQLQPASRMCVHHKAQYEIFTPSAPRHRVYFRWGQATKEACLCESQHSAKHWEAGGEGTGWEMEECDRDSVKRGYGWDFLKKKVWER